LEYGIPGRVFCTIYEKYTFIPASWQRYGNHFTLQEVNGLVEQFDRMSVQAKIIFASKSNAENMFDISKMMNDISQEELLNSFEIKLIKKPDCFHVFEDYF
jgi:hypothetical protein